MRKDNEFDRLAQLGNSIGNINPTSNVEKLDKRLNRLAGHKERQINFLTWLKIYFSWQSDLSIREENLSGKIWQLEECGSYLYFKDYYLLGEKRLVGANFCRQHLLCGLCAIRRAAKGVQNLQKKTKEVLTVDPSLNAYYIVLTVKNEPNLADGMEKLKYGWQRIRTKIKDAKRAKATNKPHQSKYASALDSQFANVVAGAYSIEFTHKEEVKSGIRTWNPHMNLLLLSKTKMNNSEISTEWLSYTEDSFITHCDSVDVEQDVKPFYEIMKYAMKFSELPFESNLEAYLTLKGKRLTGSIGKFYGLDLEPDPADEELEGEPFIDLIFQYWQGEYKSVKRN